MNKSLLLAIFLCFSCLVKAQDFKEAILHLKTYNLEKINPAFFTDKISSSERFYIKNQKQIAKTLLLDSLTLDKIELRNTSNKKEVLSLLLLGDYYYLKGPETSPKAYTYYDKAVEISVRLKDPVLITESCKKIINLLVGNRSAYGLAQRFLSIYKDYLYDSNEQASYHFFFNIIEAGQNRVEKIKELESGLEVSKQIKNDYLTGKYLQMLGVFHSYFKNDKDEAIAYMKKAEVYFIKKKYLSFQVELAGIYGNLGQYFLYKGDIEKSKSYYKKADNIDIPKYRFTIKAKLHEVLSDFHLKTNNIDSAYYHLKLSKAYKDTVANQTIVASINRNKIATESEKKDKEIVLQKQKILTEQRNKKYLLSGATLFILFGGTVGFLSLKNSRKKQLLAEQQKELATQKNLTLLKEQELTIINAMVDGQEKERTRIAEDLHDNLGSVLATLKLHFENLKFNKDKKKLDQEALFNKTENLIDEAYLKVRRIAHAKNAGVIASQGLLASIQVMAEKISAADNILIEVVHYGLEKRLENSLEIGVFRIVQELITNTMKHANATNATINLSLYDNALTIIVEDNGLGFDIEKVDLTKSMGLHSIQTRIKHLKGSLVIDSTVNKGTSIILNIPIA